MNGSQNADDIQRIIGALNTIYSSACSNQERQLAQQFCEQVKQQKQAFIHGHFLAHKINRQSDTVRYFGLGLLEHVVRYSWASYTPQEHLQFRDALLDLIQNGIDDHLVEKKFIFEKAIHLLAECMERQWPQHWPDLDAWCQRIFAQSCSHQEIVLKAFQYVAEDTFVYTNPLASMRKDDLRNSLITVLSKAPLNINPAAASNTFLVPVEFYAQCGVHPGNEGWVARFVQLLQRHLQLYATDIGNRKLHERMIINCIHSLSAFIDWLPVEILIENHLMQGLCSLLNSDSKPIRLAACEAVVLAVNRKFSDVEQLKLFLLSPLLSDAAFDVFASAWNKANGMITSTANVDVDQHLEEDYPFLKRFAQIWVDFGVEQLCHKKLEAVPAQFHKFLELSMLLTRHTSMTISALGFSVWHAFFKADLIAKSPELRQYSKVLFDAIAEKSNKLLVIPSDDDNASIGCRYSFSDFEDSLGDFQSAFGSYRSMMFQNLKNIMEHHLLYPLNYCAQAISQLVAMPFPPRNDPQFTKDRGILTTNSPFYIVWENQTSLLHAVMNSLSDQFVRGPWPTAEMQQQRAQAMELVRAMLQLLLNFQCTDPLVIGRQLDGLTEFAPMMSSEPGEQALVLLQKVFQFVTFTLPDEPKVVDENWQVSEDTTALRRKACSSLLRLAVGIPDVLVKIYADIEREIKRLIVERLVSHVEKSQLEEFLAAIIQSTTLLSPEQKANSYNGIYEPMVAAILTEKVQFSVASIENFMEAIGILNIARLIRANRGPSGTTDIQAKLNLTADELKCLNEKRLYRSTISYAVNAYRGCLSRTVRLGKADTDPAVKLQIIQQSPWAVHLHKILPLFLIITRHTHMLWDSKLWGENGVLPPEMSSVLSMSPMERSIILGKTTTEAAEQEQQRTSHHPNNIEDLIYHMRNWLRFLRESVYATLGQSSYLVPGNFFYGPPPQSLASLNPQNPTLAQALLENVFGSVTSLTNLHWRALIVFFIRPLIQNCPKEHFQTVLAPLLPPLVTFIGNKLNAEWKEVVERGLAQMGTMEEAEIMASNSNIDLSDDAKSGGASDEIVHQKILRDLTRVWTDVLSAVFTPQNMLPDESLAKKSSKKGVVTLPAGAGVRKALPEFGIYTDLVMFLLGNQETVEPLLYTMMYSMTWKDTRTCTQMSKILTKLVPLLIQDAKFHSFLAKEVLLHALQAIHDGYHQEGHDLLISLITDLYVHLSKLTPLAKETMASVVPSFADPAKFMEFDARIGREAAPTQQRKIMKQALQEIVGTKPGQWFKQLDTNSSKAMAMSVPSKMLLQKREVDVNAGWHTAVDSGANVDLGLLELFHS